MTQPAPGIGLQAGQAEQAARENDSTSSLRMRSEDLFRQSREVEIMHGGRIYRLRLTQQNKLILTA